MSLQLTFGGSEAVLVRNTGIANAVQGFVSEETVVSKNVNALPTNFLFQLLEYMQIPSGTKILLKVSDVWKEAVPWIKISGIWKQASTFIKKDGQWK